LESRLIRHPFSQQTTLGNCDHRHHRLTCVAYHVVGQRRKEAVNDKEITVEKDQNARLWLPDPSRASLSTHLVYIASQASTSTLPHTLSHLILQGIEKYIFPDLPNFIRPY
jgi:hypothetical protein